jgi:hypothetical protein
MSVSNILCRAAQGLLHSSAMTTRLFGTQALLAKRYLVTKEEVFSAHAICLLKHVTIRCEESLSVNIKDHQYVSLLHAVMKYQEAQKKCYEEEELFDLSDCGRVVDFLEAQYATHLDKRMKDAFFHMNEEARKIKVQVG